MAGEAPRIQATALGARHARRPRRVRRGRGRQQLHQAARARRRMSSRSSTRGIRSSSGGRRPMRSCPYDIALDGTSCQLVILTGPNMGGKVHLSAADRAALRDGAGRIVRAAPRSEGGARRPHLRPASGRRTTSPAVTRRSWSKCRRRPISCTRQTSRQPGRARRDRPRHGGV